MECKKCGSKWVVNKTYCLCETCNHFRIHGKTRLERLRETQKKKVYKLSSLKRSGFKPRKTARIRGLSSKSKLRITKDEETYEKVFNLRDSCCEECGKSLPDQFRGDDGRVLARFQYSHIVPKSIADEIRHDPENFNRLCLEHHTEWEHGDQAQMKIWDENSKKFQNYLVKSY